MSEEIKKFSRFESLTEEKKKKIIDVCVEEFSQNGYKNASTNNIVKNAEISKGILFHYFGTKKSLYLYVFDYVVDVLTEAFNKNAVDLPADFFERLIKIGILKLKSANEFPLEYKFLLDAVIHVPEDLKAEIQERYDKVYKKNVPVLFNGIDTTKFRSGIDKGKANEIIMIVIEGLSNKYLRTFKDMAVDGLTTELQQATKDFNEYIEILKGGVYETRSND